jgi:oxaloacetate decarboxylase alpha subunit
VNLKEIKEIINLMNENDLTEIEVEKEGMRIKLKKGSSELAAAPFIIEKERIASLETKQGTIEKISAKTQEIKAPMVGTFYSAPSPEAPSFIEAGQTVEAGQVVCIIEAMKLMNEIKSEIRGKVLEVLIENTQAVEFGQPMFLIEPL